MKTSLVELTWLGGMEVPQYSPIIGATFESPLYKVNESQLKLKWLMINGFYGRIE